MLLSELLRKCDRESVLHVNQSSLGTSLREEDLDHRLVSSIIWLFEGLRIRKGIKRFGGTYKIGHKTSFRHFFSIVPGVMTRDMWAIISESFVLIGQHSLK